MGAGQAPLSCSRPATRLRLQLLLALLLVLLSMMLLRPSLLPVLREDIGREAFPCDTMVSSMSSKMFCPWQGACCPWLEGTAATTNDPSCALCEEAFTCIDVSSGHCDVPLGTTAIGSYAFSGTNATSVVLPSTLKYILPHAFDYSSSLTSVTFGSGVMRSGSPLTWVDTALATVVWQVRFSLAA